MSEEGKKTPEQRAEHLLDVAFDEILSYLEMAFRQADEKGDPIAFTFRAEIDGRGEEAKFFCACQQKPEPAKSEKKFSGRQPVPSSIPMPTGFCWRPLL